jgi:cupin fold WbuC family metalloprotein
VRKALPNPTGSLIAVGEDIIEQGIIASRESERKRIIYPLHRKQNAPVQRMLNFLQPGTYIRPHLHPRDGATESMFVMQGAIDFIVYDENGVVKSVQRCKAKGDRYLIDIEPKVWHSFIVQEPDTILFEVKMGPYDEKLDKQFASWAPDENTPEVEAYMDELSKAFQRHHL